MNKDFERGRLQGIADAMQSLPLPGTKHPMAWRVYRDCLSQLKHEIERSKAEYSKGQKNSEGESE